MILGFVDNGRCFLPDPDDIYMLHKNREEKRSQNRSPKYEMFVGYIHAYLHTKVESCGEIFSCNFEHKYFSALCHDNLGVRRAAMGKKSDENSKFGHYSCFDDNGDITEQ